MKFLLQCSFTDYKLHKREDLIYSFMNHFYLDKYLAPD